MQRLLKRRDFLAAAKGRRCNARSIVLQARRRADGEDASEPRLGFTVTKKVGNAVERNRVRRRLREAARQVTKGTARPDHDYVVIGRREALKTPFDALLAELGHAFHVVHEPKPARPRGRSGPSGGGADGLDA